MTTSTLLTIGGFALLASCGEPVRGPEPVSSSAPLVQVSVAEVSVEQWPSTYEATGTVRARASTVIAAKWMGYVREVKVQVGDHVSAGQTLALLDARDLDAAAGRASAARAELKNTIPEAESALAAAKAHLDLVETTHRRMSELYSKKSISDQEFDESAAKLKAAQADFAMARARRTQLDDKLAQADQDVQAAQVNRSFSEIQSPVAGVVTAKPVEPGSLAVPGAPLLTIESGGFRLEASIDESKVASVRLGGGAAIQVEGIDRPIEARISEIVPAVDAASRSYVVKIDLPSLPALRSGMFGRATFTTGALSVLTIPQEGLVERGQLQSVFVADGGFARARLVTTGAQNRGRTEVLSGLSAGEKVIVPVPRNLTDGSRIEVRP